MELLFRNTVTVGGFREGNDNSTLPSSLRKERSIHQPARPYSKLNGCSKKHLLFQPLMLVPLICIDPSLGRDDFKDREQKTVKGRRNHDAELGQAAMAKKINLTGRSSRQNMIK